MPRTTNITPPSFNDPIGTTEPIVPAADSSLEGTFAAQDLIFNSAWSGVFAFSLVVSLLLLIGIMYVTLRLRQIRKAEREYYQQQPLSKVAQQVFGITDTHAPASVHAARWRDVVHHAHADNESQWRQAILEADVMLDDAITSRGYIGDGLGEKMKKVSRSDLNSIDDAWEAHKLRNRIAHEGSDFELNQRDTRRAISLYENVFKELQYIE